MLVLVWTPSTPAVTAALVEVTADGVARCRRAAYGRSPAPTARLLAPQIAAVLAEAGRAAARPDRDRRRARPRARSPVCGSGWSPPRAWARRSASRRTGSARWTRSGRRRRRPGRVLVATDARRREVYWAIYDGGVRASPAPSVDTPAVVAGRARELGVTAAVGEGALRYGDLLGLPVGDRAPLPAPRGARRARRRADSRGARRRAAHPALPAPPRRRRSATRRKSVLP